MQAKHPEYVRVLAFPDIKPEIETKTIPTPEVSNHNRLIIACLGFGVVFGLTLGITTSWVNPSQQSIRAIELERLESQRLLTQTQQCLRGISDYQ